MENTTPTRSPRTTPTTSPRTTPPARPAPPRSTNAHIPPPPTNASPNARMTVFPRHVAERALVYSYPPKVGVHRRGTGASSSGASSSSSQRATTIAPRESPSSFASPSSPSSSNPSPSSPSPSIPSPSIASTSLATPTRYINRTFLVIPDGTQWPSNGEPCITYWPSESQSVQVRLPDSKKWAGVNYPQHFPRDSVEFSVAECFSRLPQYQDTLGDLVSGSFLKRTKKRKGVGADRAYRLEAYTQEVGAVFGKLSANTVVVYVPAVVGPPIQFPMLETPPVQLPSLVETSPLQTPLRPLSPLEPPPPEQLPFETPSRPLSVFETPPRRLPPSQMPSSSSSVIDLTLPTFEGYGTEDEIKLDFYSNEWIRLQEAYFAALERRDKKMSDTIVEDYEDMERSSSFWKSFCELEEEVREGDATSSMKSIVSALVERRNLKRGINCTDADLNQVTAHVSMRMFTPADFKLEFENNARIFWREWDDFDHLIGVAPKDAAYLDAAHVILHSHGAEGIERIHELQDLFKIRTSKKISFKLLELMCKSNTASKDMEEEELLHRRKEVEMALLDFQRYFLRFKVFYSYMRFSDSSRLVDTVSIKVIQGQEFQAFCNQWLQIVRTNNACYKATVEYIHGSGIEEKNTIDEDGLRNSWLTTCWKEFISLPFYYSHILEYTSNEGALLHPMKDSDIVRPQLQLDTGRMIGHLIWEIASKHLEVNRPLTYSTLLMICNQVPQSEDLTQGVDLQLRSNLERDFRLSFPSKWSILHQLRQSFEHAAMLVCQLAEDEINEELGWTFFNFKLQESTWAEQVETKLGSIIWSHLFKGRELVGKALREGFLLAIQTAPVTARKKETYMSEVLQLTAECLKIAFSGSCSIEPEQFMKAVKFESTISEDHQIWFSRAVYEMTHSERMRLAVFITGLEFFSGSQITVGLLNRDDDPCIQSSTCFSQLYLPRYSSYETMVRMISYSTMDTSYGRP